MSYSGNGAKCIAAAISSGAAAGALRRCASRPSSASTTVCASGSSLSVWSISAALGGSDENDGAGVSAGGLACSSIDAGSGCAGALGTRRSPLPLRLISGNTTCGARRIANEPLPVEPVTRRCSRLASRTSGDSGIAVPIGRGIEKVAAWIVPNGEADQVIAPARRDRRLLRQQRGKVLIAGLRRRQKEHEGGETEGGNVRPLRSVTRRNHTHYSRNTTQRAL